MKSINNYHTGLCMFMLQAIAHNPNVKTWRGK